MGALDLKSKTVLTGIGAIFLFVGNFIQAGVFDLASFIALAQQIVTPLLAIFLRHTVAKKG